MGFTAITRQRPLSRALALCLCVAAAGCAGSSDDAGIEQPGPGQPGQMQEMPGGMGGAGEMTPLPGVRQLVIDGAISRLGFPDEALELGVFYLDARDQPVVGERVQVKLVQSAGGPELTAGDPALGGAALASLQSSTDDAGKAVFRLMAGDQESTFSVEASATGADPVYWNITLGRSGGGRLRVSLRPAAGVRADEAEVALYASGSCGMLASGSALEPMQVLPPVRPLSPAGSSVESGELAAGAVVSVAAEAFDMSGSVAFGCVDGVEIQGGQETPVTVELTALPLAVAGTYDTTHTFNLTEALGQNAILDNVARIGAGVGGSRGAAIVELACEYVELNDVICFGLRTFGGAIIDNFIEGMVAPETLTALEVLGDIYRAVRFFNTTGTITLNANLSGNAHRWTQLDFIWREGCPFERVEDCTYSFNMVDLEVPGGMVEGLFEGDSPTPDALNIGEHLMPLPYGTAVRLAAENWLLPTALGQGGAVSVADIVGMVVPCVDLAASIPGGVITPQMCEDLIVAGIADLIYDQFAQLNPGFEGMRLTGSVQLTEGAGRQVTGLEEGMWTTTIDGLGPASGTFEGCRQGADCQ